MRDTDENGVAARFRILTRCHNCRLKSERVLDVPNADDAPTDVESLLESAFLSRQSFRCSKCENPIGTIIGVNSVSLAA